MPTFIDMSALTKRTSLTGNEEFQVSATEKVTAQQIADLASTGIQTVTVTNFKTNIWNDDSGSNVFSSVPVGGMVVFKSAVDATSGPGVALFGYAIKNSSLMASYVGMTQSNGVSMIPTLYTNKSSSVYDTKWQKLPDEDNGGVQVVEITDFAIPSVNITKDGQSFLFYANDASNIPNSNHGATSFVGVAIASPIYITGDQRLLYYMMVDTAKAMFYTGYANLEDDTVTWSDTPVTRLGQAVQVTAFTEGALSALVYDYKPGDFIPFYTGNVTASTANQFPESGVFNGFISMGSNEGDYFQIFAFKSGSTKAYSGACIGSTTQWTALGGGGGAEPQIAQVNGFGEIYDNNPWLKDLPKGSIVPFETTSHGGASDMGPWGNFANSITGYIHVTLGPEGEEDRGAYIYAFLDTSTVSTAAGQGCCAYAYIQSSDGGETGGVAQESEWYRVGDLPIAEFMTDSPIQINGSLKVGDVVKMRLEIKNTSTIILSISEGVFDVSFRVTNAEGNSGKLLSIIGVENIGKTNQILAELFITYSYVVSSSLGTTTIMLNTGSMISDMAITGDYIYLERH